jgi:beta-lactamase class A
MRRRPLLQAAPASLLLPAAAAAAEDPALREALARYAALPGETSALVEAEPARGRPGWRVAHRPDAPMFVGSVFKTFVLAAWLQEVEAGRRRLDAQLAIDDSVRSPVSAVFERLTGTTTAQVVLEAMIAHSDNTATDAAIAAIGIERARQVVREAGLAGTRIPASTRRMFSAMAGAPAGTDLGWEGIQRVLNGPSGPALPPINPVETSVSTATELVGWFRRALAGAYFREASSLQEFRRIHAMADAIVRIVPPGVAAYAKGGSIVLDNRNTLAVAGQMVVWGRPVEFCLSYAWDGPEAGVPARTEQYAAAVRAVLARAAALQEG